MINFEYERSLDAASAIRRGQQERARFIAGGTLLVDLLRLNVEEPRLVLDLNGLALREIADTPEGLRVGALVSNTDLAYHPAAQHDFPALSQALLSGASPQIRNLATVGGNLLQRTRCPYFRDVGVAACNKRAPGSGCAAQAGYSRMHAVLGGSEHCIAVHPSDMCVALCALDAVVHTQRGAGTRQFAVADFHALPGAHPEIESPLERGELVTHVLLPRTALARRSAYVKARDRASFAFALASAAVALELDGKTVRQARIALGGVATKPWRSREAEQELSGQPATREVFERAAAVALSGAKTTADNAFKVKLGERTLVKALERARDMP